MNSAMPDTPDPEWIPTLESLKYHIDMIEASTIDHHTSMLRCYSDLLTVDDWRSAFAYLLSRLRPVEVELGVIGHHLGDLAALMSKDVRTEFTADDMAAVTGREAQEDVNILVLQWEALRDRIVESAAVLSRKKEARRKCEEVLVRWLEEAKRDGHISAEISVSNGPSRPL